MRYLENAVKFTFKNFLITLPLLISMAIPGFIMGIGLMGFISNFSKNFQQLMGDMNIGTNFNSVPDLLLNLYGKTFLVSMLVALLIYMFLAIFVYPATYGLINKKYETGSANFSDITSCMSKYIGRFIQFVLLGIAISIGATIVFAILAGIATVILITVSTVAGIILLVLFYLVFIAGCVALSTYLSLWFTSICVEDTGVIQGLKNSFKYVKGSFWMILGITLLVSLCGSIAGGILGWVPVIGSVVSSVISALAGFINIVFYFEIYREKTGRFTVPENFQQLDGGIQ